MSVTADHDPLLRVPLTPTKRLSADELDDEPRSSEISPVQLSSNKLTRPSNWMNLPAFKLSLTF